VKNHRDLWLCRGFATCLLFALALVLWLAVVQPVAAATTTFPYTGAEQTYAVPAGVDSIHVVAVGGHGGRGSDSAPSVGGPGGSGDRLEADLAVTPGQVLFVEVGGAGGDGEATKEPSVGGFNGGGASNRGLFATPGGGGGGATDIRTCARGAVSCDVAADSLASRILVAGGGGGGGAVGGLPGRAGGAGGNARTNGVNGEVCASFPSGGGGSTGTLLFSGAGGAGGLDAPAGGPGAFGLGGAAGNTGSNSQPGGGGGGGYFGGGAGGSANGCKAGGGGGGSSFAATAASNVSIATDSTGVSQVTITAPDPPDPPKPPVTVKPSNVFGFGKLKRDNHKGTARLSIALPGPGTLVLGGKGLVAKRRSVTAAGTVTLALKAKRPLARLLQRTGKAKTRATITFVPTGGDANTRTKTIKLVKAG
jgi:hypothetical protein